MDSRSGLPWPRAAALAAGVVVAAVLSGVVGLGLIPAVGLPAVAVTGGAFVFLHRRPRPARVSPGWIDPALLITAGFAVLALTGAGIVARPGGGTAWASAGLAAYPLLIIGFLRLQSARLPDREADVLVQAGLVATTFALGLWLLAGPALARFSIPLGTAELAVALAALDLLLLTLAVHLLLLPGERIFAYRGVALAVAAFFALARLGALP